MLPHATLLLAMTNKKRRRRSPATQSVRCRWRGGGSRFILKQRPVCAPAPGLPSRSRRQAAGARQRRAASAGMHLRMRRAVARAASAVALALAVPAPSLLARATLMLGSVALLSLPARVSRRGRGRCAPPAPLLASSTQRRSAVAPSWQRGHTPSSSCAVPRPPRVCVFPSRVVAAFAVYAPGPR